MPLGAFLPPCLPVRFTVLLFRALNDLQMCLAFHVSHLCRDIDDPYVNAKRLGSCDVCGWG